jgi:hypothetical protein
LAAQRSISTLPCTSRRSRSSMPLRRERADAYGAGPINGSSGPGGASRGAKGPDPASGAARGIQRARAKGTVGSGAEALAHTGLPTWSSLQADSIRPSFK